MKQIYNKILLAVILISGLAFRLSNAIFDRDFWYDEAFTGVLLKQSWSAMSDLIYRDVHPPLFYWLAKIWSAPFGYSSFGIRSFSLAMGMLSIYSIYWIGKKMFNQRAGLLAASILAISPFAIEYSQEARMYALFGLLMLWSVWFFYLALQPKTEIEIEITDSANATGTGEKIKQFFKRNKYWLLWGFLSGLCFYTHYLALFFFLLFYVAYGLVINQQKQLSQKESFWQRWRWRLIPEAGFWWGTGLIFLFFVSWVKIMIHHLTRGNLGWIRPAQFSDLGETLQIFFFGHPAGTINMPVPNAFRFFFDNTSVGLIILIFMIVLFTIGWLRKIKRQELLLLATMSFGVLFFLIIISHGFDMTVNGKLMNISIKLYVARYFMPAAIIVYLLLAGLITEVIQRRMAWIGFIGVYIILILGLKPLHYTWGWKALYDNQKELLGNDYTLIINNAFEYTAARYYFGLDKIKLYNRDNPQADFILWVVVGNDNKLTSIDEVKAIPNAVIIDYGCDWGNDQLEFVTKIDQLAICRLK